MCVYIYIYIGEPAGAAAAQGVTKHMCVCVYIYIYTHAPIYLSIYLSIYDYTSLSIGRPGLHGAALPLCQPSAAGLRGNHLSNITCLTQVFFNSGK